MKRLFIVILICNLFLLGCTDKNSIPSDNITVSSEKKTNLVEKKNNLEPDYFNIYIKDSANYFYNYIILPDYTNIIYSVTRLASDTDDTYKERKYEAILQIIKDKSVVKSYPQDMYEDLIVTFSNNVKKTFETYQEHYSSYEDYLYKTYGCNSKTEFDIYAQNEVEAYLKEKMILYIIANECAVIVTKNELIERGNEWAQLYDYTDYEDIIHKHGKALNEEIGFEVMTEYVKEYLIVHSTNK